MFLLLSFLLGRGRDRYRVGERVRRDIESLSDRETGEREREREREMHGEGDQEDTRTNTYTYTYTYTHTNTHTHTHTAFASRPMKQYCPMPGGSADGGYLQSPPVGTYTSLTPTPPILSPPRPPSPL